MRDKYIKFSSIILCLWVSLVLVSACTNGRFSDPSPVERTAETPDVASTFSRKNEPKAALPPDPVDLLTLNGGTYVQLSWITGEGTTQGFRVAYSEGPTAPNTCLEGNQIAVPNMSGTPRVFQPISPLLSETTYSFRVCAVDSQGTYSVGLTTTLTTSGSVTTIGWKPTLEPSPVPHRHNHTAVWTGSHMIIWGGSSPGGVTNTGGIYDPLTDSWVFIPGEPTVIGRERHSAIWTGSKMILWGGSNGATPLLSDGAVFEPLGRTWGIIAEPAPLLGRVDHTAIWTGSKMILWGGAKDENTALNDGASFDPASGLWTPIPAHSLIGPRTKHTAVWTGARMIIWGGATLSGSEYKETSISDSGALFDPLSSWETLLDGPPSRFGHSAVWTGSRMLIWGGARRVGGAIEEKDEGYIFNPSGPTYWQSMSTSPLVARSGHTAVWTGDKMIIYGGRNQATSLADGAQYSLSGDTWYLLPTANAPAPRTMHTAVWTGMQMIVWGGWSGNGSLKSGARFTP